MFRSRLENNTKSITMVMFIFSMQEDIATTASIYYTHLVHYLSKGDKFSPNTSTEVHRAVLRVAKYFFIRKGLLFYARSDTSKPRNFEVSAREWKKAIKEAHEALPGKAAAERRAET